MRSITLPISKSIANRLLLLDAMYGDGQQPVSSSMPEDVLVLHDALHRLREMYGPPQIDEVRNMEAGSVERGNDGYVQEKNEKQETLETQETLEEDEGLCIDVRNCGTALRFLRVYIARCYPNRKVRIVGDRRLAERDGAPTSQTQSAHILVGEAVAYAEDESPYITMSRTIREAYMRRIGAGNRGMMGDGVGCADGMKEEWGGLMEVDWSAAAFWYEYMALQPLLYAFGPSCLLLRGLRADSVQGDKVVAEWYARYFGVRTEYTADGALLTRETAWRVSEEYVCIDFARTPDLYPAIALTCERLGVVLQATGTERLRYKESDRIEAVRCHETRHDHRMAMALLVAGYEVDDVACVAKSYPTFVEQWTSVMLGVKCTLS